MAIWNVDWLNANSQRNYPLADSATGKDITGSFELPSDFLVDLTLSIPAAAAVQPGLFQLLSLVSFTGGVVLTFGYAGVDTVPIATVSIAQATHTQYASYALAGQGDFFDLQGVVTVGTFENLMLLPGGVYTFDLTGGRLVDTVVRPALRGVSSISVQNGASITGPLFGDLLLVAGQNFQMLTSGNSIQMDCIALAATLQEDCTCSNTSELPPIRTINKIGPDVDGQFFLTGNDCLTISPAGHGLVLDDVCSKPCCGCAELAVIKTDMSALFSDLNTLTTQLLQLEQVINTTRDNLLIAKTSITPICGA